MNRPILVSTLFLLATAALGAQEASPYQGTSNPPPDDTIITSSTPKPAAGRIAAPVQAAPVPEMSQALPATVVPARNNADPDSGVVAVVQSAPAASLPALVRRSNAPDPDGDIVRPQPLRPGELPEGATIRVELLDQLSTVSSEKGQAFRSRVASDVLQDGQVLIPAGAEIDGQIAMVSSGHPGGHGSMNLRPETLILADGSRYLLHAYISGTPGAKSKVGSEGTILPASRLKRDGIEYGGAVGSGVTVGAVVGGPVGAMTGGLIGAGVVTAHLLVSHPQATLNPGTVLLFTLSERLQLAPASVNGN